MSIIKFSRKPDSGELVRGLIYLGWGLVRIGIYYFVRRSMKQDTLPKAIINAKPEARVKEEIGVS